MEAIKLTTLDATRINLWCLSNPRNHEHIFLTHGTFSDKGICIGIAEYLLTKGFNCYILEWRNHGGSEKTTQTFNFETIALQDIYKAFDYLTTSLNIDKLHAITHSGGGICLSMFLINFPCFKKHLKSITFFSCQAFDLNYSLLSKFKLVFCKRLTQIIGYIPGKKLKLGPENESYYTMKQWFNWNIQNNFKGHTINYLPLMPTILIPIFSISAENDNFISPPNACKKYLEAFKNSENIYQCFGKSFSSLENYSHARIIKSKNATIEIYPIVLNWLNKYL
jgi:predicted alpha/beta hydrolase